MPQDLLVSLVSAPILRGIVGTPDETSWGTSPSPTAGGIYRGEKTHTYVFTVKKAGTLGTDILIIDWNRDSGEQTGRISLPTTYVAGTAEDVELGLTIAFAAGTYGNADSFSVACTGRRVVHDDTIALEWLDSGSNPEPPLYTLPSIERREFQVERMSGDLRVQRKAVAQPITLQLDRFTRAQADKVDRMIRRGAFVAFSPPYSSNTLLAAPLQRGLRPLVGPHPTYTRTVAAMTVDPDDGLVKSYAANTARFVEADVGSGLLSEKTRTNYVADSEDFTDASWSKTTVTVTANQYMAPDETYTMDSLASTSGAGDNVQRNSGQTAVANARWGASCWIAGSGNSQVRMTIRDGSADLTNYDFYPTPVPTRYTMTHDFGGTPTGNVFLNIYPDVDGNTGTIYAWGAQLENIGDATSQGNAPVSSYIPTSGGSATRGSDTLTWNPVPVSARQGTVSFWIDGVAGGGARYLYNNAASAWRFQVDSGGNADFIYNGASKITASSAITTGTTYHICLVWDASTTTVRLYIDGVDSANDTSATVQTALGTTFGIGEDGGTNRGMSWIRELRIDNAVWSATEVVREYERWSEDGQVNVRRRTHGREYLIDNVNLRPARDVDPDEYEGTLSLLQAFAHPDAIVDVK